MMSMNSESSPTNTRNPRPAASSPGSSATASIIDEFFRVRPLVPEQNPPGIELDGSLAGRLSMATGGLRIRCGALIRNLPSQVRSRQAGDAVT